MMKTMEAYKKVAEAEGKKQFSFVPDNMAMTAEDFQEALIQYANENHMDIVITKGGMYPEFELDGVEYEAERVFGRLGAVIWCTMKNMEEVEVKELPVKTRKKMKLIYKMTGPAIGLAFAAAFAASGGFSLEAVLTAVGFVFVPWVCLLSYKNLRD